MLNFFVKLMIVENLKWKRDNEMSKVWIVIVVVCCVYIGNIIYEFWFLFNNMGNEIVLKDGIV